MTKLVIKSYPESLSGEDKLLNSTKLLTITSIIEQWQTYMIDFKMLAYIFLETCK